jgi:hypothetical protein
MVCCVHGLGWAFSGFCMFWAGRGHGWAWVWIYTIWEGGRLDMS